MPGIFLSTLYVLFHLQYPHELYSLVSPLTNEETKAQAHAAKYGTVLPPGWSDS